jgi:hypothetical protein
VSNPKAKTTLQLTKLAMIFDKAKRIRKSEYAVQGILPTGEYEMPHAPIRAKARGYEEDEILGGETAHDNMKGAQRLVQVLLEPSKIMKTSSTNLMKTGLNDSEQRLFPSLGHHHPLHHIHGIMG